MNIQFCILLENTDGLRIVTLKTWVQNAGETKKLPVYLINQANVYRTEGLLG